MNPMVIKYVGLTGVVYGIHVLLAIAQIALCIFLIANGRILLSEKRELSVWARRFGLRQNERMSKNSLNGWLMILTGIAFVLPVIGLPYWLAIIACPIAVYWIVSLMNDTAEGENKKTGSFVQKGLIASAILLFGFTLWEGKDLVRAGSVITYKAYYWNEEEVNGWQKTNNPNVPKVGEVAPDFELTDVNGVETVRLSDFRGKKPVVLLFGSFT